MGRSHRAEGERGRRRLAAGPGWRLPERTPFRHGQSWSSPCRPACRRRWRRAARTSGATRHQGRSGGWGAPVTGCGAIPAWCCAGGRSGGAGSSCNARSAWLPFRSSSTGHRSMAGACSPQGLACPFSTDGCARIWPGLCQPGTRPVSIYRTHPDGRCTCVLSRPSEHSRLARRVIFRPVRRFFHTESHG